MTKLFGFVGTGVKAIAGVLFGSRETFILFAIAAVAAGLYAWGATARADRDRLTTWADKACAATGTEFAASGKAKRGDLCAARVAQLVRFERETQAATARALAEASAAHEAKSATDIHTQSRQVAERRAASQQMERADAQILPDDRVGGDWFDSLNRVAGLQPAPR